MVCTSSFWEVKLLDCGIDYPTSCSAELKERAELCLYSPLCAVMAGHMVNFNFWLSGSVVYTWNTCTLFIISLAFEHNHSKLEGTVHTVTH
jgi:hypothetical protein